MSHPVSVILAGGTGTRLWPLSRTYYPKQFLKLDGNSLFQETYQRARKLSGGDRIFVVTNEIHQYLVRNQIEELGFSLDDYQVLREPVGRNTLPAVAWAMTKAEERYGSCTVAIFPSDHFLEDRALDEIAAAEAVSGDYLVTFGVVPTSPHTGYGYISPGTPLAVGSRVLEFREKPDQETAARYIAKGYLWNSGFFLFSTSVFFGEFSRLHPAMSAAFREGDPDYHALESISIDYGLLERSEKVAVVPLRAGWTDLGTFRAWYEFRDHDGQGNAGDAEYIDSANNFVLAPGKKTALIGVSGVVVADTGDALLVCNTKDTERVSELVKRFRERGDPIADFHLEVFRPWGSYTELERSRFFRIKRVTVKPGKKLSLQMHHHRSEHWIVVSGMADVFLADRTLQLAQGESTYVAAGTTHRLGNSGKIPLEVIEVQIGEYLEEDDIVRFSDDYNRV